MMFINYFKLSKDNERIELSLNGFVIVNYGIILTDDAEIRRIKNDFYIHPMYIVCINRSTRKPGSICIDNLFENLIEIVKTGKQTITLRSIWPTYSVDIMAS